jgi:hypothetical protein
MGGYATRIRLHSFLGYCLVFLFIYGCQFFTDYYDGISYHYLLDIHYNGMVTASGFKVLTNMFRMTGLVYTFFDIVMTLIIIQIYRRWKRRSK